MTEKARGDITNPAAAASSGSQGDRMSHPRSIHTALTQLADKLTISEAAHSNSPDILTYSNSTGGEEINTKLVL